MFPAKAHSDLPRLSESAEFRLIMHIYEKGGHGMATGDRVTNNCTLRTKNRIAESAAWIADNRIGYIEEIK